MKKFAAVVLFCTLLASGPVFASAAIPGVPDWAEVYPVDYFNRTALWYAWADDSDIHIFIKLISESFLLCGDSFDLKQNGVVYENLTLINQWGEPFCGYVIVDAKFTLKGVPAGLDFMQPFTLVLNANRIYQMNIIARLEPDGNQDFSKLLPENGIWKNADQTCSLYLQKYSVKVNGMTGSDDIEDRRTIAVVVTMDGKENILFLSQYCLDDKEIVIGNDVGSQGYVLKLTFSDPRTGVLALATPCGTAAQRLGGFVFGGQACKTFMFNIALMFADTSN